MNWNYACEGGWDLSKDVLWVFVGQLAAKLQAVKVGGLEKILPLGQPQATQVRLKLGGRIFFKPPILTACSFAVSWRAPPVFWRNT